MKGIPFEVVIMALCGVAVVPFDRTKPENIDIIASVSDAMRSACQKVRANPIERPRPNEVGNDMEPFVIAALNAHGLVSAAPKTGDGKGKSTGYPDVRVKRDDVPIYIEVKTYAAKNRQTTQRSFYLSPSETPKVVEDAIHLLVGFEIEREGNFYKPAAFEIVDLYGLDCDMKAEFNSDNRRLYDDSRVLVHERVDQ